MASSKKVIASLKMIITDWIPIESVRLMWQIFFVSKNRGVSPEFHFPWIYDRKDLHCVRLVLEDEFEQITVASLVIRHKSLDTGKKIGLIGLVCVAANFRGLGLSTRLLQQAVELAKDQELTHLVLWTTKPDVYRKLGFKTDRTDIFGQVSRDSNLSTRINAAKDTMHTWISAEILEGAPPFANEVVRYSGLNGTSLSICKSGFSETLVEHTGPMDQVLDLINQAMPDSWNINVPENAPIIQALYKRNYDTSSLKPSVYRMTLSLCDDNHLLNDITFFDRI